MQPVHRLYLWFWTGGDRKTWWKPTVTWGEHGKLSMERNSSSGSNAGPWSRDAAIHIHKMFIYSFLFQILLGIWEHISTRQHHITLEKGTWTLIVFFLPLLKQRYTLHLQCLTPYSNRFCTFILLSWIVYLQPGLIFFF